MGCGPSHVRMEDADDEEDLGETNEDGENLSIEDKDCISVLSTVPSELTDFREKPITLSDDIVIDAELEDALEMEKEENAIQAAEQTDDPESVEDEDNGSNLLLSSPSGDQNTSTNELEKVSKSRVHKRSIFEISLLEKADGFKFQFTKSKQNLFSNQETHHQNQSEDQESYDKKNNDIDTSLDGKSPSQKGKTNSLD